MPAPVGQVCGPISTGGYGNTKQNLHVFDQTIGRLINDGKTIFDQVPFEDPMQKMKVRGLSGEDLLLEFYLPIFESQVVNRLFFIHGWESSKGAVWEHEQGLARGMDIVYLDKDFLR